MHRKLLLAAALLAASFSAHAADLASQVKPLPAIALPATCTTTQCSGWYAGFGISGDGTNSNITAGGISSSIFTGGAVVDVHGGYQVWNGNYLFAVEAGIGNQFTNGPISSWGSQTLYGYEGIKLGGSLAGLIGTNPTTGTTVPGQAAAPVAIYSSLANMVISPYIWLGAVQRGGINQGTVGAGVEYALASGWNLDTRYIYAPSIGSTAALQQVTLGLNYHFTLK